MKQIKTLALAPAAFLAALLALVAPTAFAVVDYSDITDAAVWTEVIPVVLAIAAGIAGVLVVIKGVRFAFRLLR